MKEKLICILVSLTVTAGLMGCSHEKPAEETTVYNNVTTSDSATETTFTYTPDGADKKLTITAGENQVMLDEVRYYAYTAQATYETYYITKGSEIDWNSKMDGDVTWEQGVKSLVLDDICKREWLNQLASQYDIKLTKKEKSSIQTKASEYFKSTNVKLAKKINISEERLITIFEKAKIAEKTEKKLEKDGSSTKEMYINWKKGNNVTAELQWNNINFKKVIFTLEDIK